MYRYNIICIFFQVEVTTNSTCATTVHAIRDTELACLPAGLLNTIKLKQPQVVSRLIQVLGERILGSYNRPTAPISSSLRTAHISGVFYRIRLSLAYVHVSWWLRLI